MRNLNGQTFDSGDGAEQQQNAQEQQSSRQNKAQKLPAVGKGIFWSKKEKIIDLKLSEKEKKIELELELECILI